MLALESLVTRVQSYHPSADLELIRRAYHFSEWAHREQTRKSGEPYFVHPASVAGIAAELKLDTASVHTIDGNFGLSKLTIENTPGFNSPLFLSLASGALEVKMGSLTSDVVEAPKLELDGLEVYLERSGGKTN